jgi:DNA-directed RNA polymerase specialized sigma24 family protein
MSDEASGLSEDALPLARKMDRAAVETLLRAYYPRVCRIALALCGREKDGRTVARTVMDQSLRTIPWWHNDAEATNWFLHHTVLTSREHSDPPPEPAEDILITTLSTPSPEHIAFVKAVRHLPPQQREAFILARAEHLDARQSGVAMDCSTGAATNHRMAAEKTLQEVTADTFDARSAELVRVYASLTPPEALVVGDVSSIASQLTVRKAGKGLKNLIILAILAVIAWIIWQLSKMIII